MEAMMFVAVALFLFALLYLATGRKKKKVSVVTPQPVVTTQPVEEKQSGNGLLVLFLLAAGVIGYLWWTAPGRNALGLANFWELSTAERFAQSISNPIGIFFTTRGAEGGLGLETAGVLLAIAFFIWIIARTRGAA